MDGGDIGMDSGLEFAPIDAGLADAGTDGGPGCIVGAKISCFGPPVETDHVLEPRQLATGDFNRDGLQDLVIGGDVVTYGSIDAGFYNGAAMILYGLPDGGFAEGPLFPCEFFESVWVSDVNVDGWPDLILMNGWSYTVDFEINLGDGGFEDVPWSVGQAAYEVTVADLNGDGYPDLLFCADYGLLIYFGSDGGSGAAQTYLTNVSCWSFAVADFNGDGKPDIASLDIIYPEWQSTLAVRFGIEDGGLTNAVYPPLQTQPELVRARDLNGDGWMDLVLAGDGLDVLLNVDAGSSWTEERVATPGLPDGFYLTTMSVADFNGDGFPDMAATSNYDGSCDSVENGATLLFLNDGQGNFLSGQPLATGLPSPNGIAAWTAAGEALPSLVVGTACEDAGVLPDASYRGHLVVLPNRYH